jgi:RNA methyltransferase, TrmH family
LKLLTVARDLKRRKARERNTMFVVEGIRASEELLRSPIRIRGALITGDLASTPRGARLLGQLRARVPDVVEVEDRDLASAANTDSPQGVLLVADIPGWSLENIEVKQHTRLLLLDGIQDPGNAGTMLRTAVAFGAAACIALPGTVDLWSAKVVRSAMGAQFANLTIHADLQDVLTFMKRNEIVLWGSSADAPRVESVTDIPARLALAVGNEGSGLSAPLQAAMQRSVGIATSNAVESLNVSVAAGILMHELFR